MLLRGSDLLFETAGFVVTHSYERGYFAAMNSWLTSRQLQH
jgi:hypothetical protein